MAEPGRLRARVPSSAGDARPRSNGERAGAAARKLRAANRGGDVHLVGGPRTIETFRALGALDTLELVVLPLLFGGGMRLTSALDPGTGLSFERARALPGGSVEIVYGVDGRSESPAREAGWAPDSQLR